MLGLESNTGYGSRARILLALGMGYGRFEGLLLELCYFPNLGSSQYNI